MKKRKEWSKRVKTIIGSVLGEEKREEIKKEIFKKKREGEKNKKGK